MRRSGVTLLEVLVSLAVLAVILSGTRLARWASAEPPHTKLQACRQAAVRERRPVTRLLPGPVVCRPDGSVTGSTVR